MYWTGDTFGPITRKKRAALERTRVQTRRHAEAHMRQAQEQRNMEALCFPTFAIIM